MLLPRCDAALVEEGKVREYLLDISHADGAAKARFFESLGFAADRWQDLADALLRLARSSEVSVCVESAHGRKYIIEGEIDSPIGRRARVRTVWTRGATCRDW
jgi:hypothetical protein